MGNATAKKSRKSILRGSDNYVAQTIKIEVGKDQYKFDIREVSATAQCEMDAWPEQVAEEMQIDATGLPEFTENEDDDGNKTLLPILNREELTPIDIIKNDKLLGLWLKANGHKPCPTQIAIDGENVDVINSTYFTIRLENLWDIAICSGLAGWDLDEPFDPETAKLLPKTVKRKLYRAIDAGSSLGVGAENFFL